jgi:hypothetical protein
MSLSHRLVRLAAVIITCLGLFELSYVVFAQRTGDRTSPRGGDAIQAVSAYEWCRTLASPTFSGRLTGHASFTAAAKWAAGQFERWGLKALPSAPGYLQAFPTQYTNVASAEMSLVGPAGTGPARTLEPGADFLPLLFTDGGDRTGAVVFVGWGISAPDLRYDDYAGVDVKEKWALCFRGTPDPADRRFQVHDEHRTRMRVAKEKGALGIVYIYDEPIANPNGDWIKDFTPVVIGHKTADLILKPRETDTAALRAGLLREKHPRSFETGSSFHLTVKATHVPDGTGYNIVGLIEGSDPALRKEYVVIGAHADHCGAFQGMYFPGANDNASGTATVMEMARVLASAERKPKRSVVIALFGGEEMGLKGSEFLAAHPPPELGTMVAMLNFDMTG